MLTRKRDYTSKPVRGQLHKELIHVYAKRGSISGRQHPDTTHVSLIWEPDGGKTRVIVREWVYEDDYDKAKEHYDYLTISA